MTEQHSSALDQARRIRRAILSKHGYDSEALVPGIDRPSAIEEASTLATVNAHWGIASSIPIFGRLVVLGQRSVRIALRWYINPIVEQQNAFNDAVVRALYELQAENDKLRARIEESPREVNNE